MNPSYVRLQLAQEVAVPRFSSWIDLPELEPPAFVRWNEIVEAATEGGAWRGAAFCVYENNGWTIFEDETGHLGTKSAEDWLRLAADTPLVYAGYNDAVPYGVLVVVTSGEVARNFLDDEQDPAQNVNEGHLSFEDAHPITSWVEAASFVDSDDLAELPDFATLYIFRT